MLSHLITYFMNIFLLLIYFTLINLSISTSLSFMFNRNHISHLLCWYLRMSKILRIILCYLLLILISKVCFIYQLLLRLDIFASTWWRALIWSNYSLVIMISSSCVISTWRRGRSTINSSLILVSIWVYHHWFILLLLFVLIVVSFSRL